MPNFKNRFERTRDDHRHEMAEDYVELIETLVQESGVARAVDLAERLRVSQVTVSRTLRRLERDGFLTAPPYRTILLTPKGAELAAKSRDRHNLVFQFLVQLGISMETAESDAAGIEHHVSEETLVAMKQFVAMNHHVSKA